MLISGPAALAAPVLAVAPEGQQAPVAEPEPSTPPHPLLALAESPSAGTIAAAAITVYPDGTGLPAGQGTARAGRMVYERQCRACHGASGTEGPNDALAGGAGSLASATPLRTVNSFWPHATTLFDYVRRAMPYTAPGSLSNDELYAVTAYVLSLDGIVTEDQVINADSLPGIAMPNADGFDSAWPLSAAEDQASAPAP